MSHEDMDARKGAAAEAAPGPSEGEDVKVPVENDDTKREQAEPAEPTKNDGAVEDLDEEAMIAEAIRRGEEAAEADIQADVEKVRAERDELAAKLADAESAVEGAKKEAADAVDRLARLQADWENYRRRTATERLNERSLATEKLVTNLLPVIDDMERAVAHAASTGDGDENLATFADGVSAVRAKMLDILAQEGVEPIDPKGEPFEPLCHQAVGRVEDKDVYDETVRDVYQLGYRMAGKVIRPAMVTITYGGEKRPVEEAEGAEPGSDGAAGTDEQA